MIALPAIYKMYDPKTAELHEDLGLEYEGEPGTEHNGVIYINPAQVEAIMQSDEEGFSTLFMTSGDTWNVALNAVAAAKILSKP